MLQNNPEIIAKIEKAIDGLRPYLEADGGNMTFVELTADNIVKMQLHGSCQNCSMSAMTLKAGIEQAIKNAVPQVVAVEAID
jgi:Fe-S cluster biogenesis protein NfuA